MALAPCVGGRGGCAGIFREGTAGADDAPWLWHHWAGPADDSGCWRMTHSGLLLWLGCTHWHPPGCPSNLLSFDSEQREAKGFAEREPEEERRSL